MLINLFHVALLGLLFLYTLRGSRCAATRRLSLVPLAMCGMEIFLAGVLDTLAFPVLGVLLVLARAAVAVCCVLAVRRDAALARAKSDKRARAARAKLRALESRRLTRAAA